MIEGSLASRRCHPLPSPFGSRAATLLPLPLQQCPARRGDPTSISAALLQLRLALLRPFPFGCLPVDQPAGRGNVRGVGYGNERSALAFEKARKRGSRLAAYAKACSGAHISATILFG